MRWMSVALVLGAVILAGCTDLPKTPEPPLEASAEDVARAAAASGALKSELAGRLFEELGRSGPVAAVEVCSQVAEEIARRHSRDGLTVRRVSLRVRNPANRPDAWEREELTELGRLAEADALPESVVAVTMRDGRHELRYLEPLRVAPPCLTCHGDPAAMSAELAARLDELYPEDRATGYGVGDLRGAVSVRFEIDSPTRPGGGSR